MFHVVNMKADMKIIRSVVIIVFLLTAWCSYGFAQMAPPDFKFYGITKIESAESSCFFDAGNIKNLSKSTREAWMKCIQGSEFSRVGEYLKKDDGPLVMEAFNNAKNKIESGYMPPSIQLGSIPNTKDGIASTATLEAIVSKNIIRYYTIMLIDIDCSENKFRIASEHTFDRNGPESIPGPSRWEPITPDGLGGLSRIVCR